MLFLQFAALRETWVPRCAGRRFMLRCKTRQKGRLASASLSFLPRSDLDCCLGEPGLRLLSSVPRIEEEDRNSRNAKFETHNSRSKFNIEDRGKKSGALLTPGESLLVKRIGNRRSDVGDAKFEFPVSNFGTHSRAGARSCREADIHGWNDAAL